jgi:hypothetical protein
MAAGEQSGKQLKEIIDPDKIASIALIKDRGKDSPIAEGFRPQWSSNGLLQKAFSGEEAAKDWGLSATESSYADYAIITKKGELYLVEVICDLTRGSAPTAILIRGSGFGCRIDLLARKNTEQDAAANRYPLD